MAQLISFVNRAGARGITCTAPKAGEALVVFSKTLQEPGSVHTDTPITRPGKHAFEVVMPVKQGKTAIGWMAEPPFSQYMTPDFTSSQGYISMGGAGYVYPLRKHCGSKYGQADVIRTELEVNEHGQGMVRFQVNGQPAGEAVWQLGAAAYPAISCQEGEVVCEVKWLQSE